MLQGKFNFTVLEQITFCCECGLIKGVVSTRKWGIHVLFECTDCHTCFSMEVKE